MRTKFLIIVFLCYACVKANAQTDSTRVFSISDLFTQILAHHPVAKQARLLDDRAKQEIRFAKGLLDPKFSMNFYEKDLTGLDYFTIWDNQLKIPIWYGTDIKTGYEKNSGLNLNGENFTPPNGLSYLGISVPVLQGLIIDERRASIKQAKLMPQLANAEKVKIINKLLLQASKEYWDWYYRYQRYLRTEKGYEFALFRFNAVKARVEHGDLSPMDTVEAVMNLQDRSVQLQQALVEFTNQQLLLSTYLWSENEMPVELPEKVIPQNIFIPSQALTNDSLAKLIATAEQSHPEIVKLETKMKQLNIEKKYHADKLKPKFNVDYNFIQKGFYLDDQITNYNYNTQNFKLGFNFNYPLLLRQERSKLSMTKIKLLDNQFELEQTNREVQNNIRMAFNEWSSLRIQLALQTEMVSNATVLRNSEQILFDSGESSLFLVNSREVNLISNQIKLAELQSKFEKNRYLLMWNVGKMIP